MYTGFSGALPCKQRKKRGEYVGWYTSTFPYPHPSTSVSASAPEFCSYNNSVTLPLAFICKNNFQADYVTILVLVHAAYNAKKNDTLSAKIEP